VKKTISNPQPMPGSQSLNHDIKANNQTKLYSNKKPGKKVQKELLILLIIVVAFGAFMLSYGSSMLSAWVDGEMDKGRKGLRKHMVESEKWALAERKKRIHGSEDENMDDAALGGSRSRLEKFMQVIDTIESVEWGTSPENIPNIQLASRDERLERTYYRCIEKETEIIKVYTFFKNELFLYSLITRNKNEAEVWVAYLKDKFGRGEIDSIGTIRWIEGNLTFCYNARSDGKHLFMIQNGMYWARASLFEKEIDSQQTNVASNGKNTKQKNNGNKKKIPIQNGRFAEFRNIVDSIEEVDWGTNPNNIKNITLFEEQDQYGVSKYLSNETEILKVFEFFNNKLYLYGTGTKDPEEAKMWVEYLNSKLGKGKTIREDYIIWEKGVIISEYIVKTNNYFSFDFWHVELLAERNRSSEEIKKSQQTSVASNQKVDGYKSVSFEDLRLDIKSLYKEKVKTKGAGQLLILMDDYQIWLFEGSFDLANPITVDATSLPRNQRKYLLQNCQSFRCNIMVYGKVETDIIGTHIIVADKISW
jgi:hypothetical protein